MKKSLAALFPATLILLLLTLASASAQQAQAVILSYSSYTDTLGYQHVVGEIQNVGSNTLSQVTVNASLCDPTSTIQDYTMIDFLVPQQKSPFDLFENVTGNICGISVTGANVSDRLPYRDFELTSQSASLTETYHVVGQVNNTGTSVAYAVEVVATYYDASGVVVQVGSSLTTPTDLLPGQSGYFDVFSDDPAMSARIATFSLQVQSASPVLPVPEYSLSAPVLVFSLAVVLTFARRKPPKDSSKDQFRDVKLGKL